MKKIIGLIFTLSFILGGVGIAKAADNQWKNAWGVKDGSLYALALGSDGLTVYAGGEEGGSAKVWKYSSGAWTDITGGLTGNHLYTLLQAKDGSIYAGGRRSTSVTTSIAQIWRYASGSWTVVGNVSGDNTGLVFSLLQASDGIYAGGYSDCDGNTCHAKVWKSSTGTSAWTDVTGALDAYYVSALLQTSDGIYAGGYTGVEPSVWKYSGGTWTDVTGALTGDYVTSLLQTSDGIYAGVAGPTLNHAGVWRYASGAWTDVTGEASGTTVNSLVKTPEGAIYAGAYDSTLASSALSAKVWKYSSGVWNDATGDMTGTIVRSIIQDINGVIYCGGSWTSYAWVWNYTSPEALLVQQQQQNLAKAKKVTLKTTLNGFGISGQGLTIFLNQVPAGNKWMQWKEYTGYPSNWPSANKQSLKIWWKMSNNFGNKNLKVQVKFRYLDKLYQALQKNNRNAKESRLALKYFDSKTKKWKKYTGAALDVNNNTLTATFTKLPNKEYSFAIGL